MAKTRTKSPPAKKPKPARRAKPATSKRVAKSRTFEQAVAPYGDDVRMLANHTRAFVREQLPDAIETVDNTGPYIGYGSSSGYKGQV
jgi:hypothetical protein